MALLFWLLLAPTQALACPVLAKPNADPRNQNAAPSPISVCLYDGAPTITSA